MNVTVHSNGKWEMDLTSGARHDNNDDCDDAKSSTSTSTTDDGEHNDGVWEKAAVTKNEDRRGVCEWRARAGDAFDFLEKVLEGLPPNPNPDAYNAFDALYDLVVLTKLFDGAGKRQRLTCVRPGDKVSSGEVPGEYAPANKVLRRSVKRECPVECV